MSATLLDERFPAAETEGRPDAALAAAMRAALFPRELPAGQMVPLLADMLAASRTQAAARIWNALQPAVAALRRRPERTLLETARGGFRAALTRIALADGSARVRDLRAIGEVLRPLDPVWPPGLEVAGAPHFVASFGRSAMQVLVGRLPPGGVPGARVPPARAAVLVLAEHPALDGSLLAAALSVGA